MTDSSSHSDRLRWLRSDVRHRNWIDCQVQRELIQELCCRIGYIPLSLCLLVSVIHEH